MRHDGATLGDAGSALSSAPITPGPPRGRPPVVRYRRLLSPPLASVVALLIKASHLIQSGAVVALCVEDSERVRVLAYVLNASEGDSHRLPNPHGTSS